MENDKLTAPF